MKLGYTILYVKDVKKSLEFWERAFGFSRRMLDEKELYAELDTGATALGFVRQSYVAENIPGGFRAAQNDEAPPPFENPARYTRLGSATPFLTSASMIPSK